MVALAVGCATTPEASNPTSTTSAAAPTTTIPTAAPINGFGECVDPDDHTLGNLTKVTLAGMGDTLQITWTARVPVSDQHAYYVQIGTRQIGLKTVGREVFRFVFDLTTGKQTNLTSAYTDDGGVATLVVPVSALTGVGSSFTWYATLTNMGADVDRCPDAGDSQFSPREPPA